MNRNRFVKIPCLVIVTTVSLSWGADQAGTADVKKSGSPTITSRDPNTVRARQKQRVTPEQRKKAAAAQKKAATLQGRVVTGPSATLGVPPQGGKPNYFGPESNWAYTPLIRKFVDPLPGLYISGVSPTPAAGTQYIPVAVPDTATYPGSDYYEIELGEYTEKMHSDLNPTTLRGYRQINTTDPAVSQFHYLGPLILAQKGRPVRIKFINSLPTGAGGDLFVPVDTTMMGAGAGPHMVMPTSAQPTTDTTDDPKLVQITSMDPHNLNVDFPVLLEGFTPAACNGEFHVVSVIDPMNFTILLKTDPGGPAAVLGHVMEAYTDNRATLHLHGGLVPWISDGTPHQWITPAGEFTNYDRAASAKNVPDMPDPGAGAMTFFWPNQQSARLMFYHDHAFGITRLNVYAGEAAGYVLEDDVEKYLQDNGIIPPRLEQIPLIIQDKTFINPANLLSSDPTWPFAINASLSNLWMPHVYMPNQNPNTLDGVNPLGRWDYGPWIWPPFPSDHPPIEVADGSLGFGMDGRPDLLPNLPDMSVGMEAFFDTPVVNGTAYPYLEVQPKAYRFRILNAANDRFWNLQLHEATSIIKSVTVTNGGSGYTSAPVVSITDATGVGATAEAVIDPATGAVTAVNVLIVGSGYSATPTVSFIGGGGSGAAATANVHTALTEVGMVPFGATQPDGSPWPAGWPVFAAVGTPVGDLRDGGVPDPRKLGPKMIQIGTEGGFLPKLKVWDNIPIGWDRDPKSMTVGNVQEHNLFLGCAERADVIVDFSPFAGKTLILYNDAPAAVPARDPRWDYYTCDFDQTDVGGAPNTQPGFGPNTRTLLQIRVASTTPATAFDLPGTADDGLGRLEAAFATDPTTGAPGVFARSQDPIIVPQDTYNSAYNATFPNGMTAYERIQSLSLTFNPLDLSTPAPADQVGTAVTLNNNNKAIIEEFNTDWGRMEGFLGIEVPFTNALNQTSLWFRYQDPTTEILNDTTAVQIGQAGDGTQLWKITHNGVDTHPIHFHLFNVQVVNRVDWAGVVKPPEDNELGWKETVRMNPLEDCIVALRPFAPKQPFGVPDSIRLLDPAMPEGVTTGFQTFDANGDPVTVTNQLHNFGWEYVWHCHILSHEEMDMMRPMQFNVARSLPLAPVLTVLGGTTAVLSWTDATPASDPATLGNPANEVGFRIERAVNGGAFALLAAAPANATTFTDSTITLSNWYSYRVIAFNAAGDSMSNVAVLAIAPGAPLNVTAVAGNAQATVSFAPPASNGGSAITLYTVTSSPDATHPSGVTAVGAAGPITVLGLTNGATYTFTVTATNAVGTGPASSPSNPVTPPGANLALGKPAVASTSYTGYPALNTTDGNPTTRWSSAFSDNQWIYVDLRSIATIQRVVLKWEVAYGRSYKIQVSNNAVSWTDVYSTTTGDGGVDDIMLATPATGRFVRMLGIQRATAYGYSLYEFEVYGVAGAPVNLALVRPAVASTTYAGYPALNTTDGNPTTRWSSAFSDNQWIYVDLGTPATFQRVVLNWEVAYGQSYKIQLSSDAVSWTDVYSTTTGDGGIDDITLAAPATGRYVRMLGIQRATVYGYSLYEFEIY